MAKFLRRRLALAVLGPLAFLALLEGALRLAGYGFTPRLLIPDPAGDRLTTNPEFGRLFFPRALVRRPEPLALAHPKPAGEFRVFVLGESAALGIPDPAYAFGRQLEVLFADAAAGRRIVVANLAMTAINSHAFPLIAREAIAHGADALILYAGHNEVVGPFGVGTVFDRHPPGWRLVRLKLWLRGTRVGQLLATLREGGPGDATPEAWGGLGMFVDRRVAADDPRLAHTYADFRANLTTVLRRAHAARVPVLLCTVPVNLRDCPPLSDPPDGAASAAYQAGQARLAAGDHAAALADLQRARDLDQLRFRADTRINDLLRELGTHTPGVHLVDAERAFAADGPPGSALFWEHVHLTFAGHYQLARLLAAPLAGLLRAPVPATSADQIARVLAYTPADQARLAADIESMTARPPFTSQAGHAEAQRMLRVRVAELRRQARAQAPAIASVYAEALRLRPDDVRLRVNHAQLLRDFATNAAAEATAWRWVVERLPDNNAARLCLVRALNRAGRSDEARRRLADLRRQDPADPQVTMLEGDLALQAGQFAQAEAHYRTVLARQPRHAAALLNLGVACQRLGRLAEAEQHFRASLDGQRSASGLADLGHVLLKQNRFAEARDCLAAALDEGIDEAGLLNNLGLCEINIGQFDLAATHLTRALAAAPDHPSARALRAQALARAGRIDAALADFRAVLERGFRPDAAAGVALVLAAAPDPARRNPAEAQAIVRYVAEQVLTPFPERLEAEAAVAATEGHYDAAATLADQAAALYNASGRGALGTLVRERASRYRQSQPAWLPAMVDMD